MIKIGITGSLSSGKTTASKILANKRGPLFSADKAVNQLYKNDAFKSLISKKFDIKKNSFFKQSVRKSVLKNEIRLKKLEKIIHPLVRKKMREFTSKNKNKKILFYEIPLLIESKLMKFFNVIIFIKSKKKVRLKRFKSKKGSKKMFNFLDKRQLSNKNKIKFCDYVVVNENNLNILKKNLQHIIAKYE